MEPKIEIVGRDVFAICAEPACDCQAGQRYLHRIFIGGLPERKLASCVNAMAGIPDPAAYVAAMKEVERLSSIASRWHWNGTTEEAGGYDDKDDLFQDLQNALTAARTAQGNT